jgi:hypothetical protein
MWLYILVKKMINEMRSQDGKVLQLYLTLAVFI